ncbi:hypothetical protein TrLO_g14216 [Triparma laevis f. longispina]|uniref:Uncharacterized protein n=1 Tax=Triparma laevis f. longispina TaxID=1714387 RepID=A0A9W7C2S3_9STRA|nr:hypothetical protein TrLO_g14216 [Triparma laevis f. longispina]
MKVSSSTPSILASKWPPRFRFVPRYATRSVAIPTPSVTITIHVFISTTESKKDYESREMGGKRGAEDKGDGNKEGILELPLEENLTTLTTVSTVPATTDQFMHTPEFRRHFVEFVHVQTLMALRVATKGWNAAADAKIDERVASGAMIVHGGEDISYDDTGRRMYKRELVTRVILRLNITKAGVYACICTANLVVVDIPEGVESISKYVFALCHGLTTVSCPTTLTSIGEGAFGRCNSLENIDLLHTNLQELGRHAFAYCSELTSMTILDSIQTLDYGVFYFCYKLVPNYIDVTS